MRRADYHAKHLYRCERVEAVEASTRFRDAYSRSAKRRKIDPSEVLERSRALERSGAIQKWEDIHEKEEPGSNLALVIQNAEAGDALALRRLGCRYFTGRGVQRDRERAVELWELAASQTDARAMMNLAVCLQDGYGTSQEEARALSIYEELAAKGYYVGLRQAAYCRRVGIGCKPDNLRALRWYLDEAKRWGGQRNVTELTDCLLAGAGDTSLERQARSWIQDAAADGKVGARHMANSLASGEISYTPDRHGVGVGYIGEDELVKPGEV
jgi:TPR repeat protein